MRSSFQVFDLLFSWTVYTIGSLWEAIYQLKIRCFRYYYVRLIYQAEAIYRRSKKFQDRYNAHGLKVAREMFEQDKDYFFSEAQKEPWAIKVRLFWDGFSAKDLKTYELQ